MPKFLFVYHGGQMPESEDAAKEVMGQWMAWLQGMGADAIDPGNPVGMSTTVYPDRVEGNGGSNPTSGYSIIQANDMDDAVNKAQGCPHLKVNGSVEIAEVIELEM